VTVSRSDCVTTVYSTAALSLTHRTLDRRRVLESSRHQDQWPCPKQHLQ